MSDSAAYAHLPSPPSDTSDMPPVSFSRNRQRHPHRFDASETVTHPWRLCIFLSVAVTVLAVIAVVVILAARRGGRGGGGDGGGGGSCGSLKCDVFPQWRLSARLPDPSVSPPPPRLYRLDGPTYVHLAVMDHLELSEVLVNGALDEYFRFHLPQLLYTAEVLRHLPELAGDPFHVQLTPELLTLYLACPNASTFYCPTPTEQQQMVDAIAAGAFTFGAFPLTVEADLLDSALLGWGLDWSAQLARETKRVGGPSNTMVLTDVHGATRGLVRGLNDSGVSALLLSTDERVRPISVPSVFEWRDEASGSSTVVLYQPRLFSTLNASDALALANFNHVLLIDRISTANHSAFTAQLMLDHLHHVQAHFPQAQVFFSTVDAFVAQLTNHSEYGRVKLPQVTQELGSSSVNGVAADPLLLASFLNLRDLRQRCVDDSACDNCSRAFFDFSRFLLAAAHPVQGANISDVLHPLQDGQQDAASPYWAWNNSAFSTAKQRAEVRTLQRSWQDSRTWSVNESLHALPADHVVATTFRSLLNSTLIPPATTNLSGLVLSPLPAGFDTGDYLVSFSSSGAVVSLIDKASGTNYASSQAPLGLFLYHWMTERNLNRSLSSYLACGRNGSVDDCDAPTLLDYSKLGLDVAFTPPPLPQLALYSLSHFYTQNSSTPRTFLFNLTLPSNLSLLHFLTGAPSSVLLRYSLAPSSLRLSVTVHNLTSTRIPSAMYTVFHPRPRGEQGQDRLEVRKVGQWVAEGEGEHVGNSSVSGWGVREARVAGYWELLSEDAALMLRNVSVLSALKGGEASVEEGEVQVAVCLQSNVWSRERAQWYPFHGKSEETGGRDRSLHFRFHMQLL